MTKKLAHIAILFSLFLGSLWAVAYGIGEGDTTRRNVDGWHEGLASKQDLLLVHYATLAARQTLLDGELSIVPAHVAETDGGIAVVSQVSPEACMLHQHAAACFVWLEGRLLLMAETYRDGDAISIVSDITLGSHRFHL